MKKCKKCGHSKKGVKVSSCGWDICMCEWDFSKMFANTKPIDEAAYISNMLTNIKIAEFKTPDLIDHIGELKDLVLRGIGHTHTIDIMDDENRDEMTNRLQKIYRTLMVIQTDELLK